LIDIKQATDHENRLRRRIIGFNRMLARYARRFAS